MSEFTVCRTLDTHPALRYCLLLDDDRIAGGKPDYRGNNILISWRTKETYGPVDALLADNAKLRELVLNLYKRFHGVVLENWSYSTEDFDMLACCMRELGVEVSE